MTVRRGIWALAAVFAAAAVFFSTNAVTGEEHQAAANTKDTAHETVINPSPDKAAATIGGAFDGEELNYRVSFWPFSDVAAASISIKKDSGGYIATMKAKTTGVGSWFLSREDVYVSRFDEVDGGKRFRSLSFKEDVVVGKKKRKVFTVMDYDKKLMSWNKVKTGREPEEASLPIPDEVTYDCPLAAFYNFRYGVYGPTDDGKEFKINTLPRSSGKEVKIYLKLVEGDEKKSREKGDKPGWHIADAVLDKDLFGSKTGDIEITFNDKMVPVRVVAKDLLLFGDVKGELIREPSLRKAQ